MPKASGSMNKPVRIANPRAVPVKRIRLEPATTGPHRRSLDGSRTSTGPTDNGAATPQQVY
jgi:hypothetical protein